MKDPIFDRRALRDAISLDIQTPAATQIKIVCNQTGILAHMALPSIKEVSFSYAHPLANFENCQKLIAMGHRQLAFMQPDVLAGMVLTCYQTYQLITLRGTAVEANRILAVLPQWELAKALHLSTFLTHTKAELLPSFSLDFKTYAEADVHGFSSNFLAWLSVLEHELVDISELEEMMLESAERSIPVYEIRNRLLNNQLSLARVQNQKAKEATIQQRLMKQGAKEAEAEFRKHKARAKILVSKLIDAKVVADKLAKFLVLICAEDNLKAVDDSTRDKVIARLNAVPMEEAKELTRILQSTANPFDLFDTTLDAPAAEMAEKLEAISVTKPKTIAEILAAKRAIKEPQS